MNARAQQRSSQQNYCFAYAGTRRLQNCRDGDATRIGKPLVVDHVFSERNDERDAEECAGDTTERQNHGVKTITKAENKNGRH